MVSPKSFFSPWSLGRVSLSSILSGEAVKIMQSGAPPRGVNGVPVDPEQSLPRSFPGGLAAVGRAASIFEGLMLATVQKVMQHPSSKD